jgi:nucleotide-binding universal stress UspA family protein
VSDIALEFTRIIVGLDRSAPDRTALHFAVELARLLRLNLLGLFAQDPRLTNLAAMPLMREFRMLERQWRPIEGRSLLGDLELSAAIAQKALDEVARASGIPHRFEILPVAASHAIASVSNATDIVMVSEPRTSADQAFQPFSEIVAGAMTSPASVLIFPNRIARDRGPVLAIAERPDDPSVTSAAAIASAANERMEVIATASPASSTLRRLPRRLDERMIVMTRRTSSGLAPSSLASERRVPVLVVATSDAA